MKNEVNYIQNFLNTNPIYDKIKFRSLSSKGDSVIHPVLQASQAIIDKFLMEGKRRIVIVLPDDEINIFPLLIAKYFSNIQERPEYVHNIFDDISEGQHLKLGKAVVEFVSINSEEGIIKLKVGRESKQIYPSLYTEKIKEYMLYFEKSSAALSKEDKYLAERKCIKEQINEQGMADIELLKTKRTVLNKSFLILCLKNESIEYLNDLYVSNNAFSDLVIFGGIDVDSDKGYEIYNSGKLDCLPGIIVSPRISDIRYTLEKEKIGEKIESVVVMPNKVQELLSNTGELKKSLRTNIPMVVFATENDFESFPILDELGFEFWQWTPENLGSNGLSSIDNVQESGLFSSFSKKVFNATNCEIESRIIKDSFMKDGIGTLRYLIKKVDSFSNDMQSELFELYKAGKSLFDIVTPISLDMMKDFNDRLSLFKEKWIRQKKYWSDTEIENAIDKGINFIEKSIDSRRLPKADSLDELIKSCTEKNIAIVVSNRYRYKKNLSDRALQQWRDKAVKVYSASEYIRQCENSGLFFERVIVTFFDNVNYINVKNTYCYNKLTYLLYDFENQWRQGYIKLISNSIPKEKIQRNAKLFGIKNIKNGGDEEEDTIVDFYSSNTMYDYNFERNVIKEIITRKNTVLTYDEAMECIPILFNLNTVGYFLQKHSLVDITDLCSGKTDKPISRDAGTIKRGNIILVRKSGKDIIREKADDLMEKNSVMELRKKSEIWVEALRRLSEDKSFEAVCKLINDNGGECDVLQIRYWMAGETICPDKISVLYALSSLIPDLLEKDKVEEVYGAGKAVQEYHRKAGRWLSQELRQKANEIKAIYQSGNTEGFLDGIGEISIFVVEEVLDKEYVSRNKINRFEEVI